MTPSKYEPCLCEVQYSKERRWEVLYHHSRKGWMFSDGLELTPSANIVQWHAISNLIQKDGSMPAWDTGNFSRAWALWKRHKAERRESYKPTGERMAIASMSKRFATEAEAVAAIEYSIAQNYAGIYPDKNQPVKRYDDFKTGWNE